MTPPSGELYVALEALRRDAAAWTARADALRQAAALGRTLNLTPLHFSYIGDVVGLTETYGNLQDRLTRLLDQGAANFDAMASALRAAADEYQQTDELSSRRLARD